MTNYQGIFYSRNDQVLVNGQVKLKPEVIKMPVYELKQEDFIITKMNDVNVTIYKNIEIQGKPIRYILTKDENEIVKDIILERITWQNAKMNGYTRTNYSVIRSFITNTASDNLLETIQKKLDCSEKQARMYYDNFITRADKIIDGKTISDQTLLSLIERNEELNTRVTQLGESRWKEKNGDVIKEYQNQLNEIQQVIKTSNEESQKLEQKIRSRKDELKKLDQSINEYESIASEVENEVKQRIATAQKDVTKFVSSLTYLQAIMPAAQPIHLETSSSQGLKPNGLTPGYQLKTDPDQNGNWKEELETLNSELQASGISNDTYARGLAALMYSCYCNRIPVLLAGPQSQLIAEAFAASVANRYPAIIDCSKDVNTDCFCNIEDGIVLVKNVFQPAHRDIVFSELKSHNNYFLLTAPLYDDLQLEPTDILNYAFPIMTELYLEPRDPVPFAGGKRKDSFVEFRSIEATDFNYGNELKKMGISRYAEKIIKRILYDAKTMDNRLKTQFEYLFCLIPLAYMTGQKEMILDKARDDLKLSYKEKQHIETLLGE